MKFPYPEIREGQNEFIKRAYRVLARGGKLFAGAPTGTGKTVSALFPALRALGDGRYDKIFYLTPKATIAEAVRDCLNLMTEKGADLRAVILTAKDGLGTAEIIEGILKLSTLPVAAMRGYAAGYEFIRERLVRWIEMKTRLINAFLASQGCEKPSCERE
jgi:hypothetical protein